MSPMGGGGGVYGGARGFAAEDAADDDSFELDALEAPKDAKVNVARREERARSSERTNAPADRSPYLIALDALARELDAQGRGRADTAAIRLLRQRLTEWVEDLRSVGASSDLAAAVEQLIQRLSAALALSTTLAAEAIAIAAELAKLATGAPPPRQGRAFWK